LTEPVLDVGVHTPVCDLCPRSAQTLRDRGIPAWFLPIGWSRGSGRYGADPRAGDPLEKRPLELLFNGVWTPRGPAFFACHAAFFAARRCELWMPTPYDPLVASVPSALKTRPAKTSSRRSRAAAGRFDLQRPGGALADYYRRIAA